MARFQFRLEASLRLAEQALETARKEFALELQRLELCQKAWMLQQERFAEAEEGQREAGRQRPLELGMWQIYVSEQKRRLRQRELERVKQEEILAKARYVLLEAHREVEKFQRLKDKQAKAFWAAELQREQKILDETGQVLHWRQRNK